MMIKAVLFDLDGTIADTLTDLATAGNYALECFNLPTYETDQYKYFIGRGIPNLIKVIIPEDKFSQELFLSVKAKFFEYYELHSMDKTTRYNGMLEVVRQLKFNGIKTAVVTNKAQKNAEKIVYKLYGDLFDAVIGQRDYIPVKPAPDMPKKALGILNVKNSECLFVGDSGVDCQTGVNIGAKSIGVTWGFRERAELMDNGANYIIDRPDQILEIIKELYNG